MKLKAPQLAVLIDPENAQGSLLDNILKNSHNADYLFLGGSTATAKELDFLINSINHHQHPATVLFPAQSDHALDGTDHFLLLSMLLSESTALTTGSQLETISKLRAYNTEIVSTAYLLIGDDTESSVAIASNTRPTPFSETKKILSACMLAESFGFRCIYLECGSGAPEYAPHSLVKAIKENCDLPIIVGGGVRKPNEAKELWEAGADIVVIGNITENSPSVIKEFVAIREMLKIA